MRRLSLVQEFALRSLVFVLVMAMLLGLSISFAVRQLFLDQAARTARIAAEAIVLDRLGSNDLRDGTLPVDVRLRLDDVSNNELSGAGIRTIRLWNSRGVLVYASDGQSVGESFTRLEPLRDALGGNTRVDVTPEADAEEAILLPGDEEMVEVYAPLVVSGKPLPIGAFAISQPYAPIAQSSSRLIAIVWLIIFSGSLPAYFLQLTLVRRTAEELDVARTDLGTVHERLRSSLDQLELHSLGTLQALVAAVDAKDSYTARHSIAVTDYAIAIGRRLGLSNSELADLERAGLLHDVGKIGTPEAVLLKPERLTDDEFVVITSHAEISGHIVETVPFLSHLMPIVRGHHERWDGGGYPDRLKGERIPMLARVLAVADSFDAMTSERPYRKPVSLDLARAEVIRCTGTQFDPACVKALLDALDAGEAKVYVHKEHRPRRRNVA